MHNCAQCVWVIPEETREGHLISLKLELQTAVRHQMGAWGAGGAPKLRVIYLYRSSGLDRISYRHIGPHSLNS